jgi:lipid II:glycine glycyltransferase (peptidoglycan interpeptide bridge formation enzyme)
MAPHLLQWQAMLDAQKKGCRQYDFWGAAPAEATGKEASWGGITRFKQGFTPTTPLTSYIGTFEKIFRPLLVTGYRLLHKLKS